jgi:hypothetical protein
MIVPLRRAETISNDSLPFSQSDEMEASMIAERADHRLRDDELPDRRLRNQIILANVVVWIVIVVAFRFIFF